MAVHREAVAEEAHAVASRREVEGEVEGEVVVAAELVVEAEAAQEGGEEERWSLTLSA